MKAAAIRRDENIRKYKKKHPKATCRAIGRIFGVSHTWVAEVLKQGDDHT